MRPNLKHNNIVIIIRDTVSRRQHGDVMKWKHFPRYWPFVRGIHQSPVNSTHKGQWRGALMASVICARTNGWANNRDSGDFKNHRAHYDVTMMITVKVYPWCPSIILADKTKTPLDTSRPEQIYPLAENDTFNTHVLVIVAFYCLCFNQNDVWIHN